MTNTHHNLSDNQTQKTNNKQPITNDQQPMTKFKGFPAGQTNTVTIHAQFISEVVPMIDDLAELKVCLFCYYALLQKEGQYRYLTRADFAGNVELMEGLRTVGENTETILDDALDKAVQHGFLLSKAILQDNNQQQLYFMNTEKSRAALRELDEGTWQPLEQQDVEILPDRPNVYALYEKNIGMLTSSIAEELKAAEQDYPAHWIAEAFEIAVTNNVRKWSYIRKVLERWHNEGKDPITTANIEITRLYRENFDYRIGTVMQEELQKAQDLYPQEWITRAMKLAITNNIKRWTYVRAVLAHWQDEGQVDTEPNPVIQYYRENFDYNIGTVMRAELEEAQSHFDDDWILDAMKIALENNVKRWTYVRIILERWKQEGRSDVNETTERHHQRTNQFAGLNWSDFATD